ncbi:hypothetical protein [Niameybacter massiliensis]|uniref:hypothetical protein n=1 Tax=Niameybacter massiliensis TaxID=1658108 RepID=UPI0006B688D3|nr:hypothetical protein [Niameybacter massiliensis]
MAKKHISITNKRVLDAYEEAAKDGRGSRLIEEAIIYYLDNIEHDYITKEQVQSMIMDALRNIEIKNPNYSSEELGNDIASILDL